MPFKTPVPTVGMNVLVYKKIKTLDRFFSRVLWPVDMGKVWITGIQV
jgi:hypothetical protein